MSRRLAHIAAAYVLTLGGALTAAVIALRVSTRATVALARAVERSIGDLPA